MNDVLKYVYMMMYIFLAWLMNVFLIEYIYEMNDSVKIIYVLNSMKRICVSD